jgi:signal transduction histidine kinase/ligand-binding sensor domain-containing protein/CheY-like chemotaxis protein
MFNKQNAIGGVFIFLIISATKIIAQESGTRFDNITIENGLSSSSVYAICQDSSGYIWIGTEDGLNKYDGVNFTIYNHIPGDSTSLSDNFINRLLVDRNGNLLIGTLNGLNIFDPVTNKFQLINLLNNQEEMQITFLVNDPENNIWTATNTPALGVFVISGLSEKFSAGKKLNYRTTFFPLPGVHHDGVKPEDMQTICFRNESEAWIGTRYDLYKFLFAKNNFGKEAVKSKIFSSAQPQNNPLSNDFINDIIEDKHGIIWIGYRHGGIDRIIPSVGNIFEKDSVIPFFSKAQSNKQIAISSSLKDHFGNVWFGSDNDGVYKILPSQITQISANPDFLNFKNQPEDPKSLISNQCLTLFEDRSGLIWMGTDVGISIYNRNRDNLNITNWDLFNNNSNVSVTAIVNDQEFLWLGTDDNGVAGRYKKDNIVFNLNNESNHQNSLSNNTVTVMLKDHKGNLWIGTDNGLNYLEEKEIKLKIAGKNINSSNFNIKKFYPSENNPNTISGKTIFALLEDEQNNLWIGTSGGLDCMNPENFNIIKKIKDDKLNNKCLSGKSATCLLMDNQYNIWIGTDDGLNELDKKTGIINKYYNTGSGQIWLSSNRINTIYQTKDNIYWIGTDGGGLNKFDKSKNVVKIYTVRNGLPDNVINAIEDDGKGNLWLSTNNGLVEFNIKDSSFTSYNVNDGLKSNGFTKRASFKSSDGELFFGNIKGLNSFYPNKITKNTFMPPIVIADFKIFDKSVMAQGFEKIRRSLLNNSAIELNSNQNFFSFEFAALNYVNSTKNQYKYKLDNVDPDWVNNGNRRFASYTNINPGEYLFHVKGSNNDGVWNEEGATVKIIIIPPYYKTWWFKTAAIFLIIVLIVFITQMRMRTLHEKKERELAEHSSLMKQKFLANMSHEIRTPMNAIVGMTRLLIDKEPRTDQQKYIHAIKQSSDNLLVIINDILDISKIEAGKLELEYIPFSIAGVLENVYNTMQFKAAEKGLALACKTEENVPAAVSGDRVRLTEVLLNLTGNAVKFTAEGSIQIAARSLGNYTDAHGKNVSRRINIEFSVSDTGIGIPEDKLETIFESFTQASSDTTRKFGGSGLGLTISKHLVELHEGKIAVKSKHGYGTNFIFTIPFEIADHSLIEKETIIRQKTPAASISKLKVLLAEDNEFNQVVAVDTLRSFIPGITIDIAMNGNIAMEKFRKQEYDLILMDIQMPEMDGYTAARLIRSTFSSPKNKIKIIAMTAGALKSEIQKCFDSGMDDYVTKPFDPQELIEKMNKLFQNAEKV